VTNIIGNAKEMPVQLLICGSLYLAGKILADHG
jgi:hypothetical protein